MLLEFITLGHERTDIFRKRSSQDSFMIHFIQFYWTSIFQMQDVPQLNSRNSGMKGISENKTKIIPADKWKMESPNLN